MRERERERESRRDEKHFARTEAKRWKNTLTKKILNQCSIMDEC
jgi:hypothetical protein